MAFMCIVYAYCSSHILCECGMQNNRHIMYLWVYLWHGMTQMGIYFSPTHFVSVVSHFILKISNTKEKGLVLYPMCIVSMSMVYCEVSHHHPISVWQLCCVTSGWDYDNNKNVLLLLLLYQLKECFVRASMRYLNSLYFFVKTFKKLVIYCVVLSWLERKVPSNRVISKFSYVIT